MSDSLLYLNRGKCPDIIKSPEVFSQGVFTFSLFVAFYRYRFITKASGRISYAKLQLVYKSGMNILHEEDDQAARV